MSRLALGTLLVMAGATVACKSPLSPLELAELNAAEARWAARPFQSYAIEMSTSCFCDPILNQWARVEVVNGIINRVVLVDGGTEVSPPQRTYFDTVEEVFNSIRRAQHDEYVKDIVVEFDSQLGFPTIVDFVPTEDILDGGSFRRMRNAAALPMR
jgi:hypothetical protein